MPVKDWLIGATLSILGVFAPIKELIVVTIVLILVDLVTGILAARKKQQQISSAGIRRTFTKFTVYLTGICIGWLVEHYMLEGFIPVSKIAAGLISIIEAKSVFENLDVINGNPIFTALIKKLGSVNDMDKEAEKTIEETKEEKKDGESL
jgi:hypothetical protein